MRKLHRLFESLLPSLPEGLCLAATAVFLFLFLLLFSFFQIKNVKEDLRQREKEALFLHTETALALEEQTRAARAAASHFYLTDGELTQMFSSLSNAPTASPLRRSAFRSFLLIRDSDGVSFSGDPSLSPSSASSFLSRIPTDGSRMTGIERDPADGSYLCVGSLLSLNGENYRLLTLTELDGFLDSVKNERKSLILYALLLSLLIGLSIFFTAKLLRQPYKKLSDALESMAEGDYDSRLPVHGSGEKKHLYAAYNKAADTVEESMETLRNSSDSRKRFASSMAHEMKTPLTSILCMGDVLRIKREVTDEERRELAGVIVEEARRMRALSSKLLELASAESAELEREKLSVASLLDEVSAAEAPLLALRGLKLTVIPGEDAFVFGDRELLKSLLCNLIDNAAKASGAGKTVRLASAKRLRGGKGQALIAVADEGIGMTKEEVVLATEPFYMADKARSRKAGGAGLGLALCKEIAARHDATLSIRSQKDKGTTVVLRIPLLEEKREGASPSVPGHEARRQRGDSSRKRTGGKK